MTLTITLNDIRQHITQDGYAKFLKNLGKTNADDAPVSLLTILESNGLEDALSCLRALPEEYENACRLLACDFAETALKFVPEGEDRPRVAIEAARRFARGEATKSELNAARDAARAAVKDAVKDAARDAARNAVKDAARTAARDAAWAAEGAAAKDAAWAAAGAAGAAAGAAARDAARAAEGAAARDAARDAQAIMFRNWIAQFDALRTAINAVKYEGK